MAEIILGRCEFKKIYHIFSRIDKGSQCMIRCASRIFDKYNVTFILIYIVNRMCIGYLISYLRI